MTNIKRFREIPDLLSGVVVHNDTVYTAGRVSKSKAGQSVAEQARDIFNILDADLEAAGTDKTKILKASIWLTDISKIKEFNEVWAEWLSGCGLPARAAVEAPLVSPCCDVEVMLVAALYLTFS